MSDETAHDMISIASVTSGFRSMKLYCHPFHRCECPAPAITTTAAVATIATTTPFKQPQTDPIVVVKGAQSANKWTKMKGSTDTEIAVFV